MNQIDFSKLRKALQDVKDTEQIVPAQIIDLFFRLYDPNTEDADDKK